MDNRIEINNNRINKLKKNMKIIFDRFNAIEKNQSTAQNMMNKFEFQINELQKIQKIIIPKTLNINS